MATETIHRYVVEAEIQERDSRSRVFLIIDTVKKEVREQFFYTRREAEKEARRLNRVERAATRPST